MSRLNWLLTLTSINVLVVTVERFSFTTKVLFQPFDYIRLHELLQGPVFLTISVVLSFLVLREITGNFGALKNKNIAILATFFVAGAYLYGMGEGWHEVASFTFNQYCDTKNFTDNLCGGLFVNNYYTGNILFFIGAILMSSSLIFIQKYNPSKNIDKKNLVFLLVNSLVYAFTFFAYAGFDRVLIGLYSTLILMIIADLAFLQIRKEWRKYPVIIYSAFAFTLATIASIAVRLLR